MTIGLNVNITNNLRDEKMKRKNISIKELSELAGVSIATISRVINQNGRFSSETEARVKKIMAENHYIVNLPARQLRTQKVMEVGVIVPDITNEFFCNLTLEIQTELFKGGYLIIICNTNEDSKIEQKYLKMLKEKQVSGMIRISREYSEEDDNENIPTIYLDRIPALKSQKENSITVESDNEQGGYIATKELLLKGCRNICIIIYDAEVSTFTHEKRFKGYTKALQEFGVPIDESLVIRTKSFHVDSGYKIIKNLLDAGKVFDGVFCTSDSLAVGTLRILDEYKIEVPKQVKIVGYDATLLSEFARLPISTIQQPIEEMASVIVRELLTLINGGRASLKNYIMPVSLLRRKTTED